MYPSDIVKSFIIGFIVAVISYLINQNIIISIVAFVCISNCFIIFFDGYRRRNANANGRYDRMAFESFSKDSFDNNNLINSLNKKTINTKIELLPDNASNSEIIAKINEIINSKNL